MPMGVQIGDNIIHIEARYYIKKKNLKKLKNKNKQTKNSQCLYIDFTCWVEDWSATAVTV